MEKNTRKLRSAGVLESRQQTCQPITNERRTCTRLYREYSDPDRPGNGIKGVKFVSNVENSDNLFYIHVHVHVSVQVKLAIT